MGDRLGEANVLFSMGLLARATRANGEEGRGLFTEAARIYTAIGNTDWTRRASDAAAAAPAPSV